MVSVAAVFTTAKGDLFSLLSTGIKVTEKVKVHLI